MLSKDMSVKGIQEHTHFRKDGVMQTTSSKDRLFTRLVWGFLITLLLCALPAFAQDPVPTSADPSSAEQETTELVVTVGGDNFGSDSEVDFLVTGTNDPGGITVKKVKRQGPKTLKVTIDVGPGATIDDFDIQVRSRGRTGKGIELFRVLEKTHPNQDTTAPGEPTNLLVLEETYGSVELSWTMPTDDWDDPDSGPVLFCSVNDFLLNGDPGPGYYNCSDWQPWAMPGDKQVCLMTGLDPETTYLLGVKCFDEADNTSSEAQVVAITRPFSEFQDPDWTTEEVPYPVDALLGHEFDGAGDLVIVGDVGLWDQKGKGRWAPVPTVIRIITGDHSSGSWVWSYEDVPGIADRFQIDPQGRPAFAGGVIINSKENERQLVYTFHDGEDWVGEVVTAGTGFEEIPGFAFDPDGNPAIAWPSVDDPGSFRLARREPQGQWSIEAVNVSDCVDGDVGDLAFDASGNPAITYSAQLIDGYVWEVPFEVRLVRWTGSAWVEEVIEHQGYYTVGRLYAPSLIYDPARGDFTATPTVAALGMGVCERLGADSWQCDGFSGDVNNGAIISGVDLTGELFVAYMTMAYRDVALARRLPGAALWTHEYVDYFQMYGFQNGQPSQNGPYLAIDPLDLPSLSWTWNVGGGSQTEHHLYFAWKP